MMRVKHSFGIFGKILVIYTVLLLASCVSHKPPVQTIPTHPAPRILFDDTHGQTFGNADWTIDTAYSDFAADLREQFGASVFSLSRCGSNILTADILRQMDCVVLPEPNIRYSDDEIAAIRQFVRDGGALFLIADHGGADRNFSGWDSSVIFNRITDSWGLTFLGDTFSETPLRGPIGNADIGDWPDEPIHRQSIMDGITSVGAWAATSVIVEPDTHPWHILMMSETTGLPFFVCGRVGKGRIAAIGDSAAFDDGRGTPGKNRHNAYHSWMFNHRKLAVQTLAWLLQMTPITVPDTPLPFPDRTTIHLQKTHVVIDIARGNNDGGIMDRFGTDLIHQTSLPVALNLTDYTDLNPNAILILANPSIPLSDTDMNELMAWVSAGGRLIIAGAGSRNPLSDTGSLNRLLTVLNSSVRIHSDQLLSHDSNAGVPWSLLVTDFADIPEFSSVDNAVFWGCASLRDSDGNALRDTDAVTILATSPKRSASAVYRLLEDGFRFSIESETISKDGYPVAALETIDNGIIVVLGANPFTNFQYPDEWDIQQLRRVRHDHHTARFNQALIAVLDRLRMEKTNS
jgi:hypothetical protein